MQYLMFEIVEVIQRYMMMLLNVMKYQKEYFVIVIQYHYLVFVMIYCLIFRVIFVLQNIQIISYDVIKHGNKAQKDEVVVIW